MDSVTSAENDSEYEELLNSPRAVMHFTSSPFHHDQASTGWKPLLGISSNLIVYPEHNEFQRRIPRHTWDQFSSDLKKEIYQNTSTCGCLQVQLCDLLGCSPRIKNRVKLFNSFYKVLSFYNTHLFHPMLIDAQVFAPPVTNGKRLYYIGFLIAHDSNQYLSFKRPVVGKSRGYLDMSMDLGCVPPSNFYLQEAYAVPVSVPATAPIPSSIHSNLAFSQHPPRLCDPVVVTANPAHSRTPEPGTLGYKPGSLAQHAPPVYVTAHVIADDTGGGTAHSGEPVYAPIAVMSADSPTPPSSS